MSLRSLLPLPPWSRYHARDLPADLSAALAVCFLAVPQGLAYATIAGLPPVMGLYASAVPAIVGSAFRSSRLVVAGPTNAVSLLVGAAVASGVGGDPVSVALTLALMVGAMQVLAGLLRLGALVDYISGPVVLGYITGAGVLIGVGQLYNVTATDGPRGTLWETLQGWIVTVGHTSPMAVAMAGGTVLSVVLLRMLSKKLGRRLPAAMLSMIGALVVNVAFGLEDRGLRVISDLSPIPSGFALPQLPSLANVSALWPVAVAVTVLSLVESSAIARSLAARTGHRLDSSLEFVGQGLSNLTAGFWGGYPISGSLSRSALNDRGGARSRVAGILSGVLMVIVLLSVGSVLDHTPIASLAGQLLVVAWDLVDRPRLVRTLRASRSDAIALIVTVLGTWTLRLDLAIYLGVVVSVISFLRRARVLVMREMLLDEDGRWQECTPGRAPTEGRIPGIRIFQAEGPLFFGAVGELTAVLDEALADPSVRVVILRLKRAQGMDATVAGTLAEAAMWAEQTDRRLILVGLDDKKMQVMQRSGAAKAFPLAHIIRTLPRRFEALERGCDRAREYIATSSRVISRSS